MAELRILYEDSDLIVCVKPEGVESEAAKGFAPDMVNMIRNHLAAENRGGAPYVGVIQRLDRPVTGIMVFAKNKKTAGALSKELREGNMKKTYRAVILGHPEQENGVFTDWVVKEPSTNLSRTAGKAEEGAKEAKLSYRVLKTAVIAGEPAAEVEIRLLTGRHHQIRVQFASRGLPLVGDRKYNPAYREVPPKGICGTHELGRHLCLASVSLSFTHPATRKPMNFVIDPPYHL